MGLFEHWPYANFHEMNLDWIIDKIKNVETAEANTQEYAEAAAADALSAIHSKEAAAASEQNAAASEQNAADSATAADLSADRIEEKARQIDQNTARIDNILVQGTPTEGNAELIDARVTYQNVTYTTAGDAIRAQAADLADAVEITTGYVGTGNILDALQIISDSYVSPMTGRIEDGVHITYDNSASSSAVARRISNTPVTLKQGIKYFIHAETSIERTSINDQISIDMREASDTTNVLLRETTLSGGSYIPHRDIDVLLYARIGAGYNADLIIYPVCIESKSNINDRIQFIKNEKLDPEDNILKNNLINTALTQGVSFTNDGNDFISLSGIAAATFPQPLNINKVYLEAGEIYVFSSNNNQGITPGFNSIRMDVRSENFGTVLAGETFKSGGIFKPTASGYYTFGLRVQSGYNTTGISISPTLYNIKNMLKSSDEIRICAFNVGNFSRGQSAVPAGNADMYNELIEVFKEADADIYSFSEWDPLWNTGITSESVLGSLKEYHTSSIRTEGDSWVCQMTYSDLPFYAETLTYYGDGESRHYVDDVTLISGKEVHIINTHLPFSSKEKRHEDIQKLQTYILNNNIEYYIIAGDFNLGTDSGDLTESQILANAREDVDLIESNGSKSVQGGFYGLMDYDYFMNTFENPTEEHPVRPYDNIVTSNNMRVKNVKVIPTTGSDHYALVADIVIK